MAKPTKANSEFPRLHADRVREFKRREDEVKSLRTEMTDRQRGEVEHFASPQGPAGALETFEKQIAAFEAKLGQKIAAEALAALRAGAQAYGDAPKTATLAVRDAWRSYVARVHDELGAEPNFLLLAAAFINPGQEDALGSPSFLEGRRFAGRLEVAVHALASESVPRAVHALQMLNIGVDDEACAAEELDAETSRALEACGTHAAMHAALTAAKREIGYRLLDACASGARLLLEQREKAAAREAARPKTIVERAKTAVAAVVSAVTGGSSGDEPPAPEATVFDGDAAFHDPTGADAFQEPG